MAVAFLSRNHLAKLANAFLEKHHPSRSIPVPIEEIIDVSLHIDIVPIPGLTTVLSLDEVDGIDAYASSSLTQITVDKGAYERNTNRYRFSIAHELAHIQLHAKVFSVLQARSIDEWRQARKSISTKDYAWLEWQANFYAGHVLVPPKELSAILHNCLDRIKREGLKPDDEAVQAHIEKYIAGSFAVSSEVIHRRIDSDGLWVAVKRRGGRLN